MKVVLPETVDLFDAVNRHEDVLDNIVLDALWRAFHEHVERVLEDLDGGGEDEKAEDEGADWVDDDPGGVEVDDDGGHEDAERLEEVTDDVDEGGLDVDVLLVLVMVVSRRLLRGRE